MPKCNYSVGVDVLFGSEWSVVLQVRISLVLHLMWHLSWSQQSPNAICLLGYNRFCCRTLCLALWKPQHKTMNCCYETCCRQISQTVLLERVSIRLYLTTWLRIDNLITSFGFADAFTRDMHNECVRSPAGPLMDSEDLESPNQMRTPPSIRKLKFSSTREESESEGSPAKIEAFHYT